MNEDSNHPVRLVALDLDGTLFDSESSVSEINKSVIKQAIASGIEVIISTGRPYVGLPMEFMEEVGIRYAITANGAAVYRFPEKDCLLSVGMDQGHTADVLESLCNLDLHLDAFIDGGGYSQRSMRPTIDRLAMKTPMKKYIKNTRTVVDDIVAFVREYSSPVQKITINFPPEKDGQESTRDKAYAILTSDPYFKIVSGGFRNLEMTKAGVSKAIGLQTICEATGIPVSETMACGDNENDLDIMKAAGIGVAMGNATELVKKEADYITLTNIENGVAEAIKHFCKLGN